AERELSGDLADRFAGSEQGENLEFTVGEQLVRGLFLVRSQSSRQIFSQGSADILPARQNGSDGFDQFFRGAFLVQVTGRASLQSAPRILIFGMNTQNQHRQF